MKWVATTLRVILQSFRFLFPDFVLKTSHKLFTVQSPKTMGFGHRNCAVFGCHNSGKRLDKWSRERCQVHNLLIRGKTPSVCEPPFKLFAFPTIKKNSEARKRWIKLMKRQDLKGKPWEPKPSSRVCSVHFVSGKPTEENLDPILGYQSPVCSSRKCKLPTERKPPVLLKRSRKSETHESVTDTDLRIHRGAELVVMNYPVPLITTKNQLIIRPLTVRA